MKILHVVQRYHPFRGGSELVFEELSERFAADGHGVTVYATDAWDLEYFWSSRRRRVPAAVDEIGGVTVVRWPVRHLPGGGIIYPVMRRLMTHLSSLPVPGRTAVLERLGRLSPWVPALDEQLGWHEPATRYDIVHACNVTFEALLLSARDFARRAGLPFVVTPFIHLGESGDRRIRKYYSMAHQLRIVRDADAVIAMTALERDFLTMHGVDPGRIHVVGAGCDPESVAGGDGQLFRKSHGLDDRPVIMALGANAYDKGMVHLVEAMRLLWSGGVKAELVLAGPRLSHFDHYVERLPPDARTRLHVLGPVSDEVRRDLFAAATIFVLPSRTDSFGIVYLEAWACGLPVIGARAGGVPAVIHDGRDGLLIPFGDVPALAGAIRRLIDDPAAARAMGAVGRAKLANHTWPAVYARVRDIYAGLVAQHTAPTAAAPAAHAAVTSAGSSN